MKRWQILALCAALFAAGGYFYFFHNGLRLIGRSGNANDSSAANRAISRSVRINWQPINRPDAGFNLEMPSGPQELQVTAFNELGGTEPVRMIFSDVNGDTTFAVTWEDNPPVARVNQRLPDKTLDAARDGMLGRTQTNLESESRTMASGFPARDITARNAGGGVLDARLIYTGERLYTLMALFPSRSAKREQDVVRFYNSFSLAHPSASSLPAASPRTM